MKIQSPWMGRIRGSAGNMTGCKVYDKNVMRAKAFEVNNPNTAAQQVQRGYFADLTKLVAGFTPDQLRTLFPSKPKAMSRRNALAKQLAEYNDIVGTEKVIDYASIDTLGNAPTMQLPQVEAELNGNTAQLSWTVPSEQIEELGAKIPVLVMINETIGDLMLAVSDDTYASEGTSIQLPTNWSDDNNCFAFLLIGDTETPSKSFGSFIIKVRPEKKSN